MAGSYSPLPPEIYREILARLPVKSVIRCMSVSKSCYSLVSCPDFISHHSITNLSDKNDNRVLLKYHDNCGNLVFSTHDESGTESCEHDYDEQFFGRYLAIIGSCNGLICLAEYDRQWRDDNATLTFLLWNPAIRKIVELPSLDISHSSQEIYFTGFGFDPNTSDYKVMFNLRNSDSGNNDCVIIGLREGVWRSIGPLVPSPKLRCAEAECYVNGAVHWSSSTNVKWIGLAMLSFNMTDESFREIKMPDCEEFTPCVDDDQIETRCVAFDGLVHVIAWRLVFFDCLDVFTSCSVWAMKEYGVTESWIKVSNIDLRRAQGWSSTDIRPRDFILWSKHEILLVRYVVEDDDNEDFPHTVIMYDNVCHDFVLYNTRSGRSKCVFSVTEFIEDMCPYKESLVLM